eukprot:gene4144-7454_t
MSVDSSTFHAMKILEKTFKLLYLSKELTFHWEVIYFLKKFVEINGKNVPEFSNNLTWKEIIKVLIKRNQIEFVGGGSVENDEALVPYHSIINQMSVGHHYLKEEFNYTVTCGWQIDSFGHSTVTPILFKEMGIKYLLLNRINSFHKFKFKLNSNLDFYWGDLLTHVLHDHYSPPRLFDFERNPNYQNTTEWLNEMSKKLLNYILILQKHQKSKNDILFIWGDDFKFIQPEYQFQGMNLLINFINLNSNYNLKYSTISMYFKKIIESNQKLKRVSLKRDFFPYVDQYPYDYWSGYYSLRSDIKKIIKENDSNLRNVEFLFSISNLVSKEWNEKYFNDLKELREYNSLLQHHDTITGTHSDDVYAHYKNVDLKYKSLINKMNEYSLSNIFKKGKFKSTSRKLYFNNSIQSINLLFFNSLNFDRTEFIEIYSNINNIKILRRKNKLKRVLIQKLKDDLFKIVFKIRIPPIGYSIYKIKKQKKKEKINNIKYKLLSSVENENLKLYFTKDKHLLNYVELKSEKKSIKFFQEIKLYNSPLNSIFSNGLYIFRFEFDIKMNENFIFKEIIYSNSFMKQNIKIFERESFLEFNFNLNCIKDKDIITKFKLNSNYFNFYTDRNSLNHIKRNYNYLQILSSNYYPITSNVYLNKSSSPFFKNVLFLVSQSMGVTKFGNEIEFMLNRCPTRISERGLIQSNSHTTKSKIKMKIFFNIKNKEKEILKMNHNIEMFQFEQDQNDEMNDQFSILSKRNLNVHLISFQFLRMNQILIRFETNKKIEIKSDKMFKFLKPKEIKKMKFITSIKDYEGRNVQNFELNSGISTFLINI